MKPANPILRKDIRLVMNSLEKAARSIGNNLKLIKQTNWKPRDNLTDIVGLFLKKI